MSFDILRTCGVVAVVTFGATHAHTAAVSQQAGALAVAIPATQALIAAMATAAAARAPALPATVHTPAGRE